MNIKLGDTFKIGTKTLRIIEIQVDAFNHGNDRVYFNDKSGMLYNELCDKMDKGEVIKE